jgi:hypothetical protein
MTRNPYTRCNPQFSDRDLNTEEAPMAMKKAAKKPSKSAKKPAKKAKKGKKK